MKDEIKEILDDMKIVAEHKTVGVMGQQLNFKNARILLDYIINLQKEKDKYKNVIDKIKEIMNKHTRKDGFLELNEWQTRDILELLEKVE